MTIHWAYTPWGCLLSRWQLSPADCHRLVVYQLARVGRALPTTNLILAGVAVRSFATALTSFLMLSSSGELRRALVWLLGGASLSGWQPVLALLPYIVLGLGLLLIMGHLLNVLQFGDEQARQLGLPVNGCGA